MASPFGDDFVERLVAASSGREPLAGFDGIVGFGVGKSVHHVVAIESGRATGPVEADPAITLVFSKDQIASWTAGEFSLSVAYMKGDFKPVGASGPLMAALELLDDPAVTSQL